MAVVDRTVPEAAPLSRAAVQPSTIGRPSGERAGARLHLVGPTVVALVLAAVYAIVSPPSVDLAAHLFRAQLFRHEGFAVWDNLWYSGHDILGYSVLFPAVSASLGPQLTGAIAAGLTPLPYAVLARRHLGRRALAGSLLFAACSATDLMAGRLPFAFGALWGMTAVLALDSGWWWLSVVLAVISTLCSPVAGLFTALVALGYAIAGLQRERRAAAAVSGVATAAGALIPVWLLAAAFPEGGSEPFTLLTLAPVLLITVIGLLVTERHQVTLRACLIVYVLALVGAYLVPTPLGSNVTRLGSLLAAPLAVTVLWGRRSRLVVLSVIPLLYVGWQGPLRDVVSTTGHASVSPAYFRPLLRYLHSQPGPRFRIEIPFTRFHWEADAVASRIPIARGWERQLDVQDNPIFYGRGRLTAASYRAWLHANAIRYVAVPDAKLDYSGRAEAALVQSGVPYLRLVHRTAHWRVYAVRNATPLVQGARLTGLGADWLTIDAPRARALTIHLHFTPYWTLTRGSGCVAPDGSGIRVTLREPGRVRLSTRFALGRVGAHSPRCTA